MEIETGVTRHREPAGEKLSGSGHIPISCDGCWLGKHTAYADLHRASPDRVTALRREQKLVRARQILFREGEVPPFACTLHFGWAFGYTMLPDGKRQILSFYIPGDYLSLHGVSGLKLSFAIRALTDVGLCVFDREEMTASMMKTATGRERVFRGLGEASAQLERRLTDIGRRSALGRMAQFFIDLEERLARRGLSGKAGFDFPVRQEHLADALGLTTVHVNRTLARLRKEGAIRIGEQKLELIDLQRLRELVNEA